MHFTKIGERNMEGTVLGDLFDELDKKLCILAATDSAIEYSPHMKEPFGDTIRMLNEIKMYLGGNSKKVQSYFESQ
ncbi:hypothetical protein D1872_303000 [compost metagenome]